MSSRCAGRAGEKPHPQLAEGVEGGGVGVEERGGTSKQLLEDLQSAGQEQEAGGAGADGATTPGSFSLLFPCDCIQGHWSWLYVQILVIVPSSQAQTRRSTCCVIISTGVYHCSQWCKTHCKTNECLFLRSGHSVMSDGCACPCSSTDRKTNQTVVDWMS